MEGVEREIVETSLEIQAKVHSIPFTTELIKLKSLVES